MSFPGSGAKRLRGQLRSLYPRMVTRRTPDSSVDEFFAVRTSRLTELALERDGGIVFFNFEVLPHVLDKLANDGEDLKPGAV